MLDGKIVFFQIAEIEARCKRVAVGHESKSAYTGGEVGSNVQSCFKAFHGLWDRNAFAITRQIACDSLLN